jgi:hypothetical protein
MTGFWVRVIVTLHTASQFILATSPLRPMTRNFIFQLNTCSYSPYVTSSLMRGWVCHLQLLLGLANAVILRSDYRGYSWPNFTASDSRLPNLEGQVPIFICPRNSISWLYSQALGSCFVASYDLQGYVGCIQPCLHMGSPDCWVRVDFWFTTGLDRLFCLVDSVGTLKMIDGIISNGCIYSYLLYCWSLLLCIIIKLFSSFQKMWMQKKQNLSSSPTSVISITSCMTLLWLQRQTYGNEVLLIICCIKFLSYCRLYLEKKPLIHYFNKKSSSHCVRKELGIRGFKSETHLIVFCGTWTGTAWN